VNLGTVEGKWCHDREYFLGQEKVVDKLISINSSKTLKHTCFTILVYFSMSEEVFIKVKCLQFDLKSF